MRGLIVVAAGEWPGSERLVTSVNGPKEDLMSSLLLLATLAQGVGQLPNAPATPQVASPSMHLDGTWTVLFAGRDGQPITDSQSKTVTIHGNTLTWQKDGKEHQVRFQFVGNHFFTAWPESGEHQEKANAPTAENQRRGANEQSPPQPAARNESGQPSGTRGNLPQPAAPNAVPGQPPSVTLPAQIPGQPGVIAGRPIGPQASPDMRHGVYIFAGDFLCLSLNRGWEEEHGQAKQGAPTARPQTSANQQPSAGNQAARPEANRVQSNPPGANPQAAAQKPGSSEAQKREGETRTANYPPNVHQGGDFVLILRRANSGATPASHQK
jgi:hypothetical protein